MKEDTSKNIATDSSDDDFQNITNESDSTEIGQQTNEAVEKHKCKECGKTFRLASGLKTHAIKHGRKLKCEVCKKEFFC